MHVPVRATRVVNNPYFWYFIAQLDTKLMRFADPVFLIPSAVFHKIADPQRKGAVLVLRYGRKHGGKDT